MNQRKELLRFRSTTVRLVSLIFILKLGILCAAPYQADPPTHWKVSANFSLQDFNYKEFDDNGSLLDREDGTLPGLIFGLERPRGRWVLGGRFSYYAGSVDYDGQTNTGTPITTRTDEKISEIEGRAEYWLRPEDRWAVYGGLGYRYWARDIRPTRTAGGQPVSGLFEVYDWWLVFFGTKVELYNKNASRWSLDLRVLRILAPELRVDATSQFDQARLDLGERYGMRLSLPWQYKLDKATHLTIEPYAEGWELGRSPTVPLTRNGVVIGTIFEPRSETRNYGINLGFSRRF